MDQLTEMIVQGRLRGKRLKTLAKWINDNMHLKAEIEEGYCNTDRHIRGTRLRWPGKGRYGNKLIVKDFSGEIIFQHNSAETYRENREVVDWILRQAGEANHED